MLSRLKSIVWLVEKDRRTMHFQSCIQCHQVFSRATRIHNCVAAATAVRPNCFQPNILQCAALLAPKYFAVHQIFCSAGVLAPLLSIVLRQKFEELHWAALLLQRNLAARGRIGASCFQLRSTPLIIAKPLFVATLRRASYTGPLLLLNPCLWLHLDDPATLDPSYC